jgi:hypothetical protein
MSCFNQFIISWILFLCVLVIWNIATSLVNGVILYQSGDTFKFKINPTFIYFLLPMYKLLIPIKDLLIALSFAYLYYHQGMKNKTLRDNEGAVLDKD